MATRKFLAHLDMNQNQIQNARLHPLTTAPSSASEGQIYYNTTDDAFYQYTGSAWVRIVDTNLTATTSRAGIVVLATDADVTAGTNTSKYMSVKQIKDEIAAAVAGGMHFKGTAAANAEEGVTTGNPYNPASKAIGDEYKVIAGTGSNVELTVLTAANTKENAKIGDTVICTDATNNYWAIIPSGDEPSGTVTSITLTTPTGLKVNNSNSAEITSSGTFALTVDSSHVLPTTTEIKGYSRVTVGSSNADASSANDAITFAAGGDASVSLSGKTVTYTVNDQKVKQTSKTTGEFPLLLSAQSSPTSGTAYEAGYDTDVKVNAANGTLTATKFVGDGSGLTGLTANQIPDISATYKTVQSAVSMPTAGSYTPGNEQTVLTSVTQNTNGVVTLESKKITIPAVATATPSAVATTGAVGSSAKWAKEDHTHALSASTVEGLLGVTSGANAITLARKQVFSNPESTSSTLTGGVYSWTVTHGLGTHDVQCTVKDSSGNEVYCEVSYSTTGSTYTVSIKMNTSATSVAANSYTAVIIG